MNIGCLKILLVKIDQCINELDDVLDQFELFSLNMNTIRKEHENK
jgi:hypothetical protein